MKSLLILLAVLAVACSCSKKVSKKGYEPDAPTIAEESGKSGPRYGTKAFADVESKKLVVYFDFNSSVVSENYVSALRAFIEGQKIEGGILCVGHACQVGTDEFNLALSMERACAVKSLYVQMDMSPETIIPFAKGESEPVTEDESMYHLNRRVEITFR
jgi:outer membrane protein OmpA-like peptidoglycan-associated protein